MTTQLSEALKGKITPAMQSAARLEKVTPEKVREQVALGHAVIPANPAHSRLNPAVIGREFRTKINANIGFSTERSSQREELGKMGTAISVGADCVMDLSVGPDVASQRKAMLAVCSVPFGTVPIYEAFGRAGGSIEKLNAEFLMSVIKEQAEQGVDFMTLHAGLLLGHIEPAMKRVMGIVSRGGAVLAEWMVTHRKENPLYSRWDEIMDICFEHDITVSLGDGLRPGCMADASDKAQFAELAVLGKLVKRCRDRGVQVMVEGPGHVPFNEIQMNMEKEKELCDNAPFYVLGPVVTDIAPGYDHITSCIGATAAAYYGASLLCYVTPAEHLCLPTEEDVKAGVVASLIAAHAADAARNLPGARDRDLEMSRARANFDWKRQFELALDGGTARARYEAGRCSGSDESDYCSMCGKEFCAIRATKRISEKK
jgi:phosphomethylpyrimidine synthase